MDSANTVWRNHPRSEIQKYEKTYYYHSAERDQRISSLWNECSCAKKLLGDWLRANVKNEIIQLTEKTGHRIKLSSPHHSDFQQKDTVCVFVKEFFRSSFFVYYIEKFTYSDYSRGLLFSYICRLWAYWQHYFECWRNFRIFIRWDRKKWALNRIIRCLVWLRQFR